MINLRYHIVSITAVFLALAIGVVMGTSFLGKATVDQLKTQISKAERRIDESEKANAQLTGEIKALVDRDQAMRQQGPQLLASHLSGVPVLVIASAGIDRDSLAVLQTSLQATAADFRGTLIVGSRLRLAGADAAKMSQLLGLTSIQPNRVRRVLAARVATMLATSGRPALPEGPSGSSPTSTTTTALPGAGTTSTTTAPPTTTAPRVGAAGPTTTTTPNPDGRQPQLLTDLREGGWLSYQPPAGGAADSALLTTAGYRYVFVSGSGATVPDQDFIRPVITDLAGSDPVPVVVASAAIGDDPERTRLATVGPLRAVDPINKNVSTVDDLESFDGDAAVVLALDDLDDIHGHYGVGDGASSLLPPPP